MNIVEQAEEIADLYIFRRTYEAVMSEKACGCRTCTARAMSWLDWYGLDDEHVVHVAEITASEDSLPQNPVPG
jgi:hypothetical protein